MQRKSDNYPIKAWRHYRDWAHEGDALFATLQAVWGDFGRSWKQVIDVGCGDGELVWKLLDEKVLQCEQLLSLDPSPVACDVVGRNTRFWGRTRTSDTRCERLAALANLSLTEARQSLLVIVHSSYFFQPDDLRVLRKLVRHGFSVMILENSADCWLQRVLRRLGVAGTNPRTNEARWKRLTQIVGNGPGITHKTVIGPVRAPSLRELLPAKEFFCYGTDDLVQNIELQLVIKDEIARKSQFEYRFLARDGRKS